LEREKLITVALILTFLILMSAVVRSNNEHQKYITEMKMELME
jgi:hypothetical protein